MTTMSRPWSLAILVLASLMGVNTARGADAAPVVHVNSVVANGSVRLQAQASGPFEFTTSRASESLLVVEMRGVTSDAAGAKALESDLVSGYRVVSLEAAGKPMVRLEVLLRGSVKPHVERTSDDELTIVLNGAQPTATVPAPERTPRRAATETPSEPAAIEQVKLEEIGGLTEVMVKGTARLSYKVLRLSNPDRIVLDFSGARLRTTEKSLPSNLDPVKEIRMAQFAPEVARVVIDLRTAAKYSVISVGSSVAVDFVAASPAPGAAKAVSQAADPSVATTSAAPVPPSEPVSSETSSASITAPAVALPKNLMKPEAALANEKASPESPAAPSFVFARPALVTRAIGTAQAQPAASSAAKYTGEPISVNLKDVDLRDFFRLIHEISALNVVVDPAVKGSLTIVLDDVPWDQALDIVLKNNDLDKQLEGNVLRIATKDTVKKEAEEARDLAKAQAEAAEVVTTTRALSYAKSDDLVPTLKKFLSSRGDILSDARSNTLVIRDIPSTLPIIDNLIRQLDKKTPQVEIEARVVVANRTFARDIGTQFAFAAGTASRNNVFGGATGVGVSPIVRSSPPMPAPPLIVAPGSPGSTGSTPSQLPLNTNLGAAAPTSGISYAFSGPNFALDLIITAAESKGVGKLLSRPKLITQDNQRATVKSGVKIPVQTIINNTISVQFIDAVLELEVTPHITAEGTIFMDVLVTNNQIDNSIPRIQGIPAIDIQESNNKVLVHDGGTVVIGGVVISNQRTDIQQVPLFGSIPLIGNLFKRTTVGSSSQELLFFLTPRVLPS